MTVNDLKAYLDLVPGEVPVILSRDAEGNRYLPLMAAHGCQYQDGYVELPEWKGWDPNTMRVNAVVLYPEG